MKSPKESFKSLKDTFTLSNGVQIPCVGFGTYLTPDGETAVSSVIEAVHAGYRHIDTAAVYGNEKSVGKAIRKCGTDRKELFITSKVWNSAQGYETTLHAFDKTLSDLELDYLDLYLIHWPIPRKHDDDWQQLNRETWRAMEKLYREGRVRAIGVSNFKPRHLDALLEKADIAPMVDQIELHPGMPPGRDGRVLSGAGHSRRGVGPVGPGTAVRKRRTGRARGQAPQERVADRPQMAPTTGHPAAAEVHHAVADRRERATVRLRTQPAGDEFHHAHKMRKFGTRPGHVPDVTPSHRARPYADTGSPASAYVFYCTARPPPSASCRENNSLTINCNW